MAPIRGHSSSTWTGLLIGPGSEDLRDFEFHLSTLLGLAVRKCESFEEAQEVLRGESVDVVFTDDRTDPANPFAICSFIKSDQNFWGIPIIALIAGDSDRSRAHALDYGADDYLTRPFDDAEVYRRTRAQLRMRELSLRVVESERLNVLFEMAGAAAHELAQPVTGAMGLIELIQQKSELGAPVHTELAMLYECLRRTTEVLHKIQKIRRYETTAYPGANKIIDIHRASEPNENEA